MCGSTTEGEKADSHIIDTDLIIPIVLVVSAGGVRGNLAPTHRFSSTVTVLSKPRFDSREAHIVATAILRIPLRRCAVEEFRDREAVNRPDIRSGVV